MVMPHPKAAAFDVDSNKIAISQSGPAADAKELSVAIEGSKPDAQACSFEKVLWEG